MFVLLIVENVTVKEILGDPHTHLDVRLSLDYLCAGDISITHGNPMYIFVSRHTVDARKTISLFILILTLYQSFYLSTNHKKEYTLVIVSLKRFSK